MVTFMINLKLWLAKASVSALASILKDEDLDALERRIEQLEQTRVRAEGWRVGADAAEDERGAVCVA